MVSFTIDFQERLLSVALVVSSLDAWETVALCDETELVDVVGWALYSGLGWDVATISVYDRALSVLARCLC